jgi:hypothetical protein
MLRIRADGFRPPRRKDDTRQSGDFRHRRTGGSIRRTFRIGLFVIAGMSCARAASAQRTPNASDPPVLPDTSAWTPLLTGVVERLAPHVLRAATDGSAQPWRFTLPEDGLLWERVERHLRLILNARDVAASDSSYRRLEIGPLQLSGDSARVRLLVEVLWYCPPTDDTAGYRTSEILVSARLPAAGNRWGPARSMNVAHGDKFCFPRR